MHLELPKVTLDSSDTVRLRDLLAAAWRANSTTQAPAGQYQKLADNMIVETEAIAQKAFKMGMEYAERESQ
jgi:hypothetical protein